MPSGPLTLLFASYIMFLALASCLQQDQVQMLTPGFDNLHVTRSASCIFHISQTGQLRLPSSLEINLLVSAYASFSSLASFLFHLYKFRKSHGLPCF